MIRARKFFFTISLFLMRWHAALAASAKVIQTTMTFEEDQPANTFVGLITNSEDWRHEFRDFKIPPIMTFDFLKTTSVTYYFRIDTTTGGIFSRIIIDRDALCDNGVELCCEDQMERTRGGTMVCGLNFKIKALTQDSELTLVDVKIHLVDRNDNFPTWRPNFVERNIQENADINREMNLPLAIDRDSGKNGVVLYRLKDTTQDTFILRTVRNNVLNAGESIVKVQLVTIRALDREQSSNYTLIVVAEDGSGKSAELTVKITVDDVNDNVPQFVNGSSFSVHLPENSIRHSLVLKLYAVDKDKGENGRVSYRLGNDVDLSGSKNTGTYSNENRDHNLQRTFAVDSDQGWLLLIGQLDFEQRQHYVVPVVAFDNGNPQLSSTALVTINVLDVNDEKPHIEVHPTKGSRVTISENMSLEIQRTIATISVQDKDSGPGGKVDCHLTQGTEEFSLAPLSTEKSNNLINYYSLRASVSFDREAKSIYPVTVICIDNGSSSQTSSSRFDVHISDINDCSPMFTPKPAYKFQVQENLPANTRIGQIHATDDDADKNGEVHYRLEPTEYSVVHIDSKTGTLYSRVVFDREERHTYTFHVIAMDRGHPKSFSSTATVTLEISDVNDNTPMFSASTPTRVNISEDPRLLSQATNTVGDVFFFANVNATDADLGKNALLSFTLGLVTSANGYAAPRQMFVLRDKKIGVRFSQLDRERVDQYVLVIEVRDHGYPSRTATLSMTLDVLDANDNSPRFLWPTELVHSLNITSDVVSGTDVAKVQAVDSDDGLNGAITYRLKPTFKTQDHTFFDIESKSGYLRVAQSLSGMHKRIFHLLIEASDEGSPPQIQVQRLFVHLLTENSLRNHGDGASEERHTKNLGSQSNDLEWKRRGIPNLVILLVAVLAALVLILFLIFIIYFIARRRASQQTHSQHLQHASSTKKQSPPAYDIIEPRHNSIMQVGYVGLSDPSEKLPNIRPLKAKRAACDNEESIWYEDTLKYNELTPEESLTLIKRPSGVIAASSTLQDRKEETDTQSHLKTDDSQKYNIPLQLVGSNYNVHSNRRVMPPSYTQLKTLNTQQQLRPNDDYSEYVAQDGTLSLAVTMGKGCCPETMITTSNRHMKYPYDDVSNV